MGIEAFRNITAYAKQSIDHSGSFVISLGYLFRNDGSACLYGGVGHHTEHLDIFGFSSRLRVAFELRIPEKRPRTL